MRIKSKKPLGQEDEEAAGFLEEPFAGPPPALPYKLVPPTVQPQPAVLVAASARIRQKAPLQPGNLDLPRLPWPLPHTSIQLSTPAALPTLPLPAPVPPVPRAAPPSRPAVAPGRAPAVVPKPAAAPPPAVPPAAAPPPAAPPPAAKMVLTATAGEAPAPPATKAGARQAAASAAAAPAASAAPEAAALAAGRPTRKRKQTSMGDDMIPPDALFKPYTKPKRAPATIATRSQQSKGEQAKEAKQQQPPTPPPPPPPYRLVAPALQPRPAVAVAVPIDIAHLARQLEEEERRRAAAAADALVLVQVMAPPPQLPGPMLTRSSKAAVATAAAGGKNSKQQEKGKQQEKQGEKAGPALRQRPPRPSRRNTPEPSAQQGAAAGSSKTAGGNVAWHPGMELHGGISYVDTVQSTSAKPPPAVVVGTPPRWQQEPVRMIDMVEFSDDPVRSSIEFLKHMARTAGRQPNYNGPLQQAVNAEQRLYKERLQRAVYARDGRRFHATPDQATRRSTRNRQAPQVFLPTTSQQQTARRLKVVVTADPDEQTATRMGADYQAVLPTLRSRPPAPSEDEVQWLEELVMEPHLPDVAPEPLSKLAEMAAAGSPERTVWVESSQQQLAAAVGSLAAISLGLETMGPACIRASWTEEEEEAFAAGIKAYSRDFRAVQEEYVPSRTVQDLADYYYNVWKLRATQRAVQWYQEKAQANLEYQAELARQEQAREAELARKAERQAAAGSRRQLREVLQWMKNAARCPANALAVNRPVVRDRAARAAKLIGSLNAQQPSK